MGAVVLQGVGLHSGAPARVTLREAPGPVRLAQGGRQAAREELAVVSTARATTVEGCGGAVRVGTVEHAFAALAGLGIHEGVTLEVEGPEMPLLDGGASAWCDALASLSLPRTAPRLRVARAAAYDVGPSRYEWTPCPGAAAVEVSVRLETDDPRLAPDAAWQGDPGDFVARIAPARTFAMAREVEELLRRGLARHADPASVVVVGPDAILHAGRPFAPDEPVRHKLLDLIGDLYLHGGPPLGRLHAIRPGHAANARAVRRALHEGVLVAQRPAS